MIVLAFYSEEFFSVYNEELWRSAPSQALLAFTSLVGEFGDVSPTSWYAPYVYFGVVIGLVAPNQNFYPAEPIYKGALAKWVIMGANKVEDQPFQQNCNGGCAANEYCNWYSNMCVALSYCIPGQGNPCELGGGCLPVQCGELGYECGVHNNACDGQVDCGGCPNNGECQQGVCIDNCECSFGPCCDGCNYIGTNTVCDVWDEQRCAGSNPGDDVQQRTGTQYCSGISSTCIGGPVTTTSWTTIDNCTSSEQCIFNGMSAYCSACAGNWSYPTTRSCGATYCFQIDSITDTTTTIRFSKADNTPFGSWSVYWRLFKNGATVAQSALGCEYWNSTSVAFSFPTANLGMMPGSSATLTGEISVGPTPSTCNEPQPAGSRSINYQCQ